MTPSPFRAAPPRLQLTQPEAARRLGLNERTIRRYATGERVIKEHVRLALERLEELSQ